MSVRNSIRDAIRSAIGLVEEVFNPQTLFLSGEQGVWYDPSDLSTLFQDSAGTTRVTASGQPVGLMLDKSKGLVRGPELVTNGTFDAGLSGWTVSGGAVASVVSDAGSNVLSLSAAGGGNNLNWPISIAAGKTIELTYSRRGVAAGGGLLGKIQVEYTDFSAATHPIANVEVSGAYEAVTWVLTLPKTASKIRLLATTASADTVGTTYFDNISVKELPGAHATQPTAASRPIYRRGDSRGVVNLLVNSSLPQGIPSATSSGGTVTSNLATGWAGGLPTTGVNIAPGGATSYVYISRDTADNAAHTFSAYIKMDDGLPPAFGSATGSSVLNDFTLTIDNTATNPLTYVVEPTQDPTVFRVSVSIVTSVRLSSGNGPAKLSTNSARGFTVSGFQLNLGPTALPYQRNDGNLGGVATGASTDLHWLETDGVDDGMVTGNIDFTGTDKVSVFAGVRKLSDAATGVLVELGTDSAAVNGTFGIFAPSSSGANSYRTQSRGANVQGAGTGIFAAAPDSAVLKSAADISGDILTLRRNGVVVQTTTADQGTGNYGNHPLYLFRRGGTSLPFNGWLYGMAITGRLTTDAETVATERYLAAKSGVTL